MCSFLIKCNILVKKCFAQNLKENCRQNNVCCVFLLVMSILGHRILDRLFSQWFSPDIVQFRSACLRTEIFVQELTLSIKHKTYSE